MAGHRNGVIALVLASAAQYGALAQTPAVQELPEVKVTDKAVEPSARKYPDDGYAPRGSTAGSRVELPLRDVPQSISVINQEVLRDIAPSRIFEIADYIAGVQAFSSAATPYTNAFFFRGFGTTSSSAFNGFRDGGFLSAQATVNLDRIEFLKGPASVLYGGSAGLSGLVNYVTKRPQAVQRAETSIGAGSFGYLGARLDSTGPITQDRRIRYRLTASYDEGGNVIENYDQSSSFVSPYFGWDITDRTKLDVELVAQNTRFDGRENGFPRHPVSFQLPIRTNLGPGGAGEDERRLARVDLEHRFQNGWLFRQGFYVANVDKDVDLSFQILNVLADGRTATRRVRSVPEFERDRASQTELSGVFKTGSLVHNFLAGVEVSERLFSFEFFVAPYTNVNLFDPQPGTQTGPLAFSGVPSESGATTRALYLQDLIELGAGFKLMLGGRYDDINQFSRPRAQAALPGNEIDRSAFSPRAGLIYQPSVATSYYISWTRSFQPNLGQSFSGERFDPQTGTQTEVGVKHDLRPGLTLNAAVFDYKRQNVLTPDPFNPPGFSIAVGEQTSRGFELEAIGRVTRDWSILASYGYLDAKVSKDNVLPVGDRLTGVSRHTAGLLNKVNLGLLGLANWNTTLGIAYASARPSGLPNNTAQFSASQLELPAYTKIDAGVSYETRRYVVRVVGTNLTNEKIYDGTGSGFRPRPERGMLVTAGLNF